MFSYSVFLPVEPENEIRFLEKSIINFLFDFSLFDNEKT